MFQNKIYHGDLKPENLVLSKRMIEIDDKKLLSNNQYQIKTIDFGCASIGTFIF